MVKKLRNRTITVKVTADEKMTLMAFARGECLNLSALARKLLFEQLRKRAKPSA